MKIGYGLLAVGLVLVFISGLGIGWELHTHPTTITVEEWSGDQFIESQSYPIDPMNTIGLHTNTRHVNETHLTSYDIKVK